MKISAKTHKKTQIINRNFNGPCKKRKIVFIFGVVSLEIKNVIKKMRCSHYSKISCFFINFAIKTSDNEDKIRTTR